MPSRWSHSCCMMVASKSWNSFFLGFPFSSKYFSLTLVDLLTWPQILFMERQPSSLFSSLIFLLEVLGRLMISFSSDVQRISGFMKTSMGFLSLGLVINKR